MHRNPEQTSPTPLKPPRGKYTREMVKSEINAIIIVGGILMFFFCSIQPHPVIF